MFIDTVQQYAKSYNYLIYKTLLACLLATLVVKFWFFIRKRQILIERFRECKVPLVEKPGLFGGNLLQIFAKQNNCELISKYHNELGEVYAVFYGPDPWLMTIDLKLLQRVFVAEGLNYIDTTQLRMPFVTEINESLAQIQGDKWRLTRKIMGPSFAPKVMKSDEVHFEISGVCDLFTEMIEQACASKETKDTSHCPLTSASIIMDVAYEFKKYSLEVIFRVAFGCEYSNRLLLSEKNGIVDYLDEAAHLISNWLTYLGIMFDCVRSALSFCSRFTRFGFCIGQVHSIIDDCIKNRRELLKANRIGSKERKMIDSLLESFDSGKIDSDTLEANLFFVLVAGYETSSNTLAIMFWYLAKYEKIQEKLRGLIACDGGHQDEYLDWVIMETLRLFPPVPLAVGRILDHDIEHNGMTIPKKTTIVSSTWTLHKWFKYWGDDANSFRPERFGEESCPMSVKFFAFADGPRYCIGKHLALAEIKAIAVRLLVNYRISLCSESPKEIKTITPNLIHFIVEHPIKLAFTKITNL